jgi:hypothetical protein
MSETTTACIRGCAIYRQHYTDCDGLALNGHACRGCLPRRADRGHLCEACYRRLELMLTDAPVIFRWLTGNMGAGSGAARPHEDYERGGTPDLPTPLKLQILDQRDLMADQLTEWADDWCEQRSLSGPERHTVALDATFLLLWLPTMVREEWIGDWWEALAETVSQAHAMAPWRPAVRRVKGVPCPGCGESNLVIYGGRDVDITCQSLQDPDDRGPSTVRIADLVGVAEDTGRRAQR